MATITYTPTREIVGGGGSIVTDLEAWDRSSKWVGVEHTSIGGTHVSVEHRSDLSYKISADAKAPADIAYFREFSESVRNGEIFTIDASDIPDAPSGIITYRMKSNSYKESRNGIYITPSFEVIKV